MDNIDYVFLVGGSSKLNGMRVSLEKLFGAEKVKCDTFCLCEAAIAKGAALVGLNKALPVDPVPTPPIDPIIPPPPIDNTIPYSVMIKTADGRIQEVPEEIREPILSIIDLYEEKKKLKETQELRTAILNIYSMERHGGKLDDQAKRREWLAVARQSQHCNSVEELKMLKERMEKMKSEL